ncbi:hypothetical protein A9Q87_02765 [Flavobacteriales bacterium 34_180_T64]|nr:hypothetical protein A9Q87_02765 [Flavobacteriales bacterium 34_180_T64]
MYTIEQITTKGTTYLELSNSNHSSILRIFPSLGGSLQELILNSKSIIKDLSPLNYETSYASSILFPFVNRVKNGTYTFKRKRYVLDLNQKEENNALHGLVFNKEFKIFKKETSDILASVILEYDETQEVKGFPYQYSIRLTYTLRGHTVIVTVSVMNKSSNPFPFNVGWHPYFFSSDLFNSYLSFKSDRKLSFNEVMIPVKIKNIILDKELQIKDRQFDDCYILNTNCVGFRTPDYKIKISSTSDENYLQVFTPDKENTIAIEPITGPSDSFNNKLGLQVLNTNETYRVSWTIKLLDDE